MKAFGMLLFSLFPTADPIELPKDVYEYRGLNFVMPINPPPESKSKVRIFRLYFSVDKGKTWFFDKEVSADEKKVDFTAPEDGLYWFALQAVYDDGKESPKFSGLKATMKVYVNSEEREVKKLKTYSELFKENEEMQKTIEMLQKKIADLEAAKNSK